MYWLLAPYAHGDIFVLFFAKQKPQLAQEVSGTFDLKI